MAFTPFRALGAITGDLPVSVTTLYGEPMVLIPMERTFRILKGFSLQLLRNGPLFEHQVSAAVHAGKYRVIAEGGTLHGFSHRKQLWRVPYSPLGPETGASLLLAVDDVVFAAGDDRRVLVLNIKTGNAIGSDAILLESTPLQMTLPSHYTNKLLVLTEQGLELHNFETGTRLHMFDTNWCCGAGAQTQGIRPVSIACSDYKDIIAIGNSDGTILVRNFRTGDLISSFTHPRRGDAITSVAFSPIGTQPPMLATGSGAGAVAMWNLEEKKLHGVLTETKEVGSFDAVPEGGEPHRGRVAVHTLHFLSFTTKAAGQTSLGPFLLSAGADNAVLQFRFDTRDGMGRLVRERRGHHGTCTSALFYNQDLVITTGTDRAMRVTHLFSDRATWEMSQGRLGQQLNNKRNREGPVAGGPVGGRDALKLPAISAIAANATRNYQWASIAAVHECSAKLSGWRLDTRRRDYVIEPVRTNMHSATALAMSQCGHYAIVGYSSGHLVRVNLQDQSLLQMAPVESAKVGSRTKLSKAHDGSVTGIVILQQRNEVISVSLDRRLRVWRLSTGEPIGEPLMLSAPAKMMIGHFESPLVAIGLTDFSILVVSVHSIAVVRRFVGHEAPLTAIAITPDSLRYIVSASSDGGFCIWSLPAATCVRQYRLASPATSVAFHPDGLFLITTHPSHRGAALWTNRLRYGFVPEVVTPGPLRDCPLMSLPGTVVSDEDAAAEKKHEDDGAEPGSDDERGAEDHTAASKGALALRKDPTDWCFTVRGTGGWSMLARANAVDPSATVLSRAPKKSHVPFFLPTTSELRPSFIVQQTGSTRDGDEKTGDKFGGGELSEWQLLLLKGEPTDYETALRDVVTWPPARVDMEIKRMASSAEGRFGHDVVPTGSAAGGAAAGALSSSSSTVFVDEQTKKCLAALLRWLVWGATVGVATDFFQAAISHTLVSHGSRIVACEELRQELAKLSEAQASHQAKVSLLFGRTSSLVGAFAGAYA